MRRSPRAIPSPSTRSTALGRRYDCATARCNGRESAQQNADKFRACARAPSASAVPPASGIAPVRVWRTVNVHPPCPVVNTLKRRSSTKRGVIEDCQVAAALVAGILEAVWDASPEVESITLLQEMRFRADHDSQLARLDEQVLVDSRVVRTQIVRRSEGRKGRSDELDPAAGEGGREQLTLNPRRRVAKDQALSLRNGDDRAPVLIAQKFRKADSEGACHVCGRSQRRAVLSALQIGERGAADPGRGGEGVQCQFLPLSRRAHPCAEAYGDGRLGCIRSRDRFLYHKLNCSNIVEPRAEGPVPGDLGYRAGEVAV